LVEKCGLLKGVSKRSFKMIGGQWMPVNAMPRRIAAK
jgi:hypothetical protein